MLIFEVVEKSKEVSDKKLKNAHLSISLYSIGYPGETKAYEPTYGGGSCTLFEPLFALIAKPSLILAQL